MEPGARLRRPVRRRALVPQDSKIAPAAREALIVNLLTEDNLPGYHREISTIFGRDGAWGTWVDRWTAEENRTASSSATTSP